ncbi:MAG: Uma2 family endonuclease [Pyrinomonadaceae bacterium]
MSTTTRPMTADELFSLPKTVKGNDYFYELVAGELRTMSPTGGTHGIICARLAAVLYQHVEAHNLGVVLGAECGFKIGSNPDTVIAPDVAFVRYEQMETVADIDKFLPLAPDLAVEVLSPSNTFSEIDEKIELFLAAGTRVVWIVNPRRRTITIHPQQNAPRILTESDKLSDDEILPGFRYEIAKLFIVGKPA